MPNGFLDDVPCEAVRRWMKDSRCPKAITLLEPDRKFLWANNAYASSVGYTPVELVDGTINWDDLTVKEEDLKADVQLAKQVQDGEIPNYELRKSYWHKQRYPVSGVIYVRPFFKGEEFQFFLVEFFPDPGSDRELLHHSLKTIQLITGRLVSLEEQTASVVIALEKFAAVVESMANPPWKRKAAEGFESICRSFETNPKIWATALVLSSIVAFEGLPAAWAFFTEQAGVGK